MNSDRVTVPCKIFLTYLQSYNMKPPGLHKYSCTTKPHSACSLSASQYSFNRRKPKLLATFRIKTQSFFSSVHLLDTTDSDTGSFLFWSEKRRTLQLDGRDSSIMASWWHGFAKRKCFFWKEKVREGEKEVLGRELFQTVPRLLSFLRRFRIQNSIFDNL